MILFLSLCKSRADSDCVALCGVKKRKVEIRTNSYSNVNDINEVAPPSDVQGTHRYRNTKLKPIEI